MTNTNRKHSAKKKLISAIAMLTVSAVTLSTATYAWFTMNKEVSVTGMQVKAHAEEGLLINEVKAAADDNWDELATGGGDYTAVLRPASTYNLTDWWHANSKIFSDEAGLDNLSGTVNVDNSGNKYVSVSENATGVYDETVVYAEGSNETNKATGGRRAETHVFYKDASFGDNGSGTYQAGEGFYVRYTYYLKSSGDSDLDISNLQVRVKATKNTTGDNASGSSPALDPCLRVGVTMNTDVNSSDVAGTLIFAPITHGEESYNVTTAADGGSTASVTAIPATTGSFSEYTKLNNTNTTITIPNVTSDGIPVQVYVWFEGEDEACKSQNLTDILAAYDIDVGFKDADIY